jgi:hypothetical protein
MHRDIIPIGLQTILSRKSFINHALALLTASLLWPAAHAQGTSWGFTLIGGPSAKQDESDEAIRLTGGGYFDTASKTVSAQGSFTIFNAPDENFLGGPTFRGTWKATSFVGFTSDGGPNHGQQGGTLQVKVTLSFESGLLPQFRGLVFVPDCTLTVICPFVNGRFVESGDAILFDFPPELGEEYSVPFGGATAFHLK